MLTTNMPVSEVHELFDLRIVVFHYLQNFPGHRFVNVEDVALVAALVDDSNVVANVYIHEIREYFDAVFRTGIDTFRKRGLRGDESRIGLQSEQNL